MLNKIISKLFKNDRPTVSEIDAAIAKARARRAELVQRQVAIIEEISVADGSTDSLTTEHAAIGVNLQGVELRLSNLQAARPTARLRELPIEYEATLKTLQADFDQLEAAKTATDAALIVQRESSAAEQQLRTRIISAQMDLPDIAHRIAESGEFDNATISQILGEVRAKYPAADAIVARSNHAARVAASMGLDSTLTPEPQP